MLQVFISAIAPARPACRYHHFYSTPIVYFITINFHGSLPLLCDISISIQILRTRGDCYLYKQEKTPKRKQHTKNKNKMKPDNPSSESVEQARGDRARILI